MTSDMESFRRMFPPRKPEPERARLLRISPLRVTRVTTVGVGDVAHTIIQTKLPDGRWVAAFP